MKDKKERTVLIIGGGLPSLSEIAIAKYKAEHGDDVIIVESIEEAVKKGYLYHKHTYPEPTDAPSLDIKNFPQPIIKYAKDFEIKKPIDAIMGKNKKRRKW